MPDVIHRRRQSDYIELSDMMATLKIKNYLICFLLMVFSISTCLIAFEFVLRTVFYPVDYLEPYLVPDDILGAKVKTHSSGHDSWGYRNEFVPKSVDIVTIGDSQTYGTLVTAKDSWPGKLQQLIHKDVYNLSQGGLGPIEYLYLMENNALKLKPTHIIVGFYFGNDLFDAYRAVYTRDYWKYLRKDDYIFVPPPELVLEQHKFMGKYRDWLAHHSMLYRIANFSFGNMARFIEMKYSYGQNDSDVTIFADKEFKVQTGFTPRLRLSVLNLEDRRIREGLRLSIDSLSQMHELCSKNGVDFLIVLIPTKESVYAELIKQNQKLRNSNIIDQLLINEENIRQLIKDCLKAKGISFIDVLAPLKKAIPQKIIYPINEDGHPNKAGYEIIANGIQQFLTEGKPQH